jgi:hypothetical protein
MLVSSFYYTVRNFQGVQFSQIDDLYHQFVVESDVLDRCLSALHHRNLAHAIIIMGLKRCVVGRIYRIPRTRYTNSGMITSTITHP